MNAVTAMVLTIVIIAFALVGVFIAPAIGALLAFTGAVL